LVYNKIQGRLDDCSAGDDRWELNLMYVFFCGFANIAHEKGDDFFQLLKDGFNDSVETGKRYPGPWV
jgi:hypothetical protein